MYKHVLLLSLIYFLSRTGSTRKEFNWEAKRRRVTILRILILCSAQQRVARLSNKYFINSFFKNLYCMNLDATLKRSKADREFRFWEERNEKGVMSVSPFVYSARLSGEEERLSDLFIFATRGIGILRFNICAIEGMVSWYKISAIKRYVQTAIIKRPRGSL